MRLFHRALYPVIGLTIFGAAFIAGLGPRSVGAQTGEPAAQDADGSDSLTLPPDVRHRLASAAPAKSPQDFGPAVTFWEVLGKVKTRYVDKITNQDKLTHGAVSSMLRALRDPYSRIITPEELKLDHEQALGHFSGAGLVLGARLSGDLVPIKMGAAAPVPPGPARRESDDADRVWQLVVVDTVPGSAASKADLQPGDIISKIDGVRIDRAPLATKTIDDLNLMLNGPEAHVSLLTIARPPDDHAIDVHLDHLGPVNEPPVTARLLPHNVAYVRIHLFTPTTGTDFAKALSPIYADHPSALALDLRDNSGGSLSAAEQVVGALAPNGLAGLLDTHAGAVTKLTAAADPQTFSFQRIVVLTNNGSASVAELAAAALHERAGAVLAGEATFGNGLVQSVFPLKNGWAYSLTTGRLRAPDGADFNEHGLAIDRPISPNLINTDSAVAAALPSLLAMGKAP
ncbi:MAG TPA: S41 family peptidase [Armatimonadota bacterium]|nr:S41 family peptidase [Armatimonadota bacterium]